MESILLFPFRHASSVDASHWFSSWFIWGKFAKIKENNFSASITHWNPHSSTTWKLELYISVFSDIHIGSESVTRELPPHPKHVCHRWTVCMCVCMDRSGGPALLTRHAAKANRQTNSHITTFIYSQKCHLWPKIVTLSTSDVNLHSTCTG